MKHFLPTCIFVYISFMTMAQNQKPVAVNDTVFINGQDTLFVNLLVNDYDPDGDTIELRKCRNPEHGFTDEISDSCIYYVSEFSYEGMDSCMYIIRETENTNSRDTAYCFFHVLDNPGIPVATNDTFTVTFQVPTVLDILENDFDAQGDQLKIMEITPGDFVINDDSTAIVFHKTDFNDSIDYEKYKAYEAYTLNYYYTDEARVVIYVQNNPDIPVAYNDVSETIGGTPVIIYALENDLDPQGKELEIDEIIYPHQNGTIEIQNDFFVYTPELSYTGTDYFFYNVKESEEPYYFSDTARVEIFVEKNPNCPVAITDSAEGMINTWFSFNVTNNDYDINGDEFEIFEAYSYGYVSGADSIIFDKNTISLKPHALSDSSVIIKYKIREINNPISYSEKAEVYVTLNPNPELPVLHNDFYSTIAGVPIEIDPLENDDLSLFDSLGIVFIASGQHESIRISNNKKTIKLYTNTAFVGEIMLLYIVGDTNQGIGINNFLGRASINLIVGNNFSYDTLDINNVKAGITSRGIKFNKAGNIGDWETMLHNASFEFPINSKKHTMFLESFWIGGLDETNQLHLAAERYSMIGNDFQRGPVSDHYDQEYHNKWLRLWKLNKTDIEYHRSHFNDFGYEPIIEISSWPGNGDPFNGQTEQIAPYYDTDQDEIYNPMNGDYPLIRGDQSIFFMINDDRKHTETDGDSLRLEIHGMAYAFNMSDDTVVNNTIFLHYDLINRSNRTYHNVYTALFTDFDIGCAWDDYLGCDVQRGAYFGYNGVEIDGNDKPDGYGENPPAQAVLILAGPYMDEDYFDNPDGQCDYSVNGRNFGNGIVDDERMGLTNFIRTYSSGGIHGDPRYAEEYYKNMQSLWKDSSQLQYGGNGTMNSGAVGPGCRYMWPGDSDSCNWGTYGIPPNEGFNQNGYYWTEETTGNNPGSRRAMGSMGPFTFNPGQLQEIDIAYVVARGNDGPQSSVEKLKNYIDHLIEEIDNGEILIPNDQLGIKRTEIDKPEIVIYPNPTKDYLTVNIKTDHGGLINYAIYNILGEPMLSGNSITPKFKINTGQLQHGIYFLEVVADKPSTTLKFVKY